MATSFYGLKSPEERNGWEEGEKERERTEWSQWESQRVSYGTKAERELLNGAGFCFCGRGSKSREQGR